MSTTITPVDANTVVPAPVDGEPINATETTARAQALANRAEYAQKRIALLSGNYVHVPRVAMMNVSSRFTQQLVGQVWKQTDVTDAGVLTFDVPDPCGEGSIVAVKVRLAPAGAHAGLPGTMPKIEIADVGGVVAGSATDSSASVAAYEAEHDLTLTLSPAAAIDPDSNFHYYLSFSGETGANALVDLVLKEITVLYGV